MEKYRKKLEKSINIGRFLALISAAGLVCLVVFGKDNSGFGSLSGFCGAMMAVSFLRVAKTKRALRDDEVLKKRYIQDSDERNNEIFKETAKTSFLISITGLSLAAVASSFFSDIVSCTLSCCVGFVFIVYFSAAFYYNKKM